MANKVLLIDDDRRVARLYVRTLEEADYSVRYFHSTDEVLGYVAVGGAADVIVCDMMMAPGVALQDEDTEGGLVTGRLLIERLRMSRPCALYVILTNRPVGLFAEHDDPARRSLVLSKTETSPDELCRHIREHLADNRQEQ